MIARVWRGVVRTVDAGAYGEYIRETGLSGYVATEGNRGAWLLRRALGDRTEFPEDDRFLIERDEKCAHDEVEDGPQT
jgi:hypothetical protein